MNFTHNGAKTVEPCPTCGNPSAHCEHGTADGARAHLWDCPTCGACLAYVGYDCPECREER